MAGLRIMKLFLFSLLLAIAHGYDYGQDDDLEHFVSRPDLRPPKFKVTHHAKDLVTPGYWFVAPYVDLVGRAPTKLFQPKQTGPHIYDGDGQLVWSGADLFRGRNFFDFKAVSTERGSNLSFAITGDDNDHDLPGGGGIVIDPSYKVLEKVRVKGGAGTMNMHEFSVVDDGKRGLMFAHQNRLFQEPHPDGRPFAGWIVDLCFIEIDIATGHPTFEWWASDHVHPLDSTVPMIKLPGTANGPWDWFHINSVDKTSEGDYIVSGRHMNTVFKISGKDGHVIWRLGGVNSSFVHDDDFTFSSQHHARVHEENSTTTILSFLNNASDGYRKTSTFSTALKVALYTGETPMRAKVLGIWERPDMLTSDLRGNVQLLPNNNVFVGWSSNCYISEFAEDGRCLMEAQFASWRFATYRAFKYNFTGAPTEPPTVKAFVYGISSESMSTVYYVSWNGATEVARWNFYAHTRWGGEFHQVGSVAKTGFESVFVHKGYAFQIVAEAIDAQGRSLRNSTVVDPILPPGYESVPCDGKDCDYISHDVNEPGDEGSATLSSDYEGSDPFGYAQSLFAQRSWPNTNVLVLLIAVTILLAYITIPKSLMRRGLLKRLTSTTRQSYTSREYNTHSPTMALLGQTNSLRFRRLD